MNSRRCGLFSTITIQAHSIPHRCRLARTFNRSRGAQIYSAIVNAPEQATAEERIRALELDEVDIESFLRLGGEHYHTYPALVRERADAIRRGQLKVEAA